MDGRQETEEEMKDRIRKEILDELNNSNNTSIPNNSQEVQSYGPPKATAAVNFSKSKEAVPQKVEPNKNEVVQNPSPNTEYGSKHSKVLLMVCSLIVILGIIFFPTLFKKISQLRTSNKKPSVEVEKEKEKEYPKITMESDEYKNLKYPVMHNNRVNKTTYYSLNKLTINNFSNNDILYNALLDIYEGNMAKYKGSYSGKYCGDNAKKVSLNERYLRLRIENLYTKNVKYKLTNFVVPANNTNTKYVGTWKYDSSSKKYIYYGNCGTVPTSNIEYYDVKIPYEVSTSDKNIELYVNNYVAFAMVNKSAKSYVLYKNANYTEEVGRGTLTTTNYQNELNNIVSKLDKNKLNKYKYTFTIDGCAYQDYCFLSGEWLK